MEKLIVTLSILFLFNSCDKQELSINIKGNRTKYIEQYKSGYIIKEFYLKYPNGLFRYYDEYNNLYKIEWYTNNKKPYYTYCFSRNYENDFIEINDFNKLNKKFLDTPKITYDIINKNQSLITIYHSYPINKITTTFYDFVSKSNILEKNSNSICYLIENFNPTNKFVKFEYEDNNSKIILKFDSIKIPQTGANISEE